MALLDLVIIGGGPAGMTAAIYARRKGLSFRLVTETIGGYMSKSGILENYPGYTRISGPELAGKMDDQLENFNVSIDQDRVYSVRAEGDHYRVLTDGGREYETLSVVVATGSHWRELEVPGEEEYKNKGVSYCTTCDAPLFAGMDVAVVGGGNSAGEAVLDLCNIANRVYMIVRSTIKADRVTADKIRASDKVEVFEGYTVLKIEGKDFVESMDIQSKSGERKTLSVGGVFVEIGLNPNTGFIKDLVKLNDKGEIIIDEYCRTSAKGIFACGDVSTVPQKQIVVAAGEGAKAAMAAYAYVNTMK